MPPLDLTVNIEFYRNKILLLQLTQYCCLRTTNVVTHRNAITW
jgi:hypothetical protein